MASNQQLQILSKEQTEQLSNVKVAIVKTAWNKPIIDELEKGVLEICNANNVEIIKNIVVPGAVEIPFAVQAIERSFYSPAGPDAYITLGCVIKGDTPHFDYVCQSVTQGITMLNVQLEKPVIFGILTVNTEQQAWDRLGGAHGHKGKEAAETAISMIAMVKKLKDESDKIPF